MKRPSVSHVFFSAVTLLLLARCGAQAEQPVGGMGGTSGASGSSPGIGGSVATDASLGDGSQGSLAIQKIQHVVVIRQENRSFDHCFGTFPGAEGIPMDANGVPTVCVTDPKTNTCVRPYHLTADKNTGGPHQVAGATACIDGGKMDGFIVNAEKGKTGCADPNDPTCVNGNVIDVMGYHTVAGIPNYWAYPKNFVLNYD